MSSQFYSILNNQITTIPQDGEYDIDAIDYPNTDTPVSLQIKRISIMNNRIMVDHFIFALSLLSTLMI